MFRSRLGQSAVMLAVLLGGSSRSGAVAPAGLGDREVRCDDAGCALGPCVTSALWNDPAQLATEVRLVPNFVSGQVQGFRLYAIRSGSLFAQLGLENGDVLRRANGLALDDPRQAMDAYDALKKVDEITLTIERKERELTRLLRFDRRPLRAGQCPKLPPKGETQSTAVPAPGSRTQRAASAPPLDLAKAIQCSQNRCTVSRRVLESYFEDANRWQNDTRVIPVTSDGTVRGFKLLGIRPNTPFARLLLRNGDVVRKIAGHELSSPEGALQAYSKIRSAESVVVELERAGHPLSLTYQIEK